MIDRTEREFKADVYHCTHATADTVQDIHDNAATLVGQMVACKEDQRLYVVGVDQSVVKTNLRSREVI